MCQFTYFYNEYQFLVNAKKLLNCQFIIHLNILPVTYSNS